MVIRLLYRKPVQEELTMEKSFSAKAILLFLAKLFAAAAILYVSSFIGLYLLLILPSTGLHVVLIVIACLIIPAMIPLLFVSNKLRYLAGYGIGLAVFLVACTANLIYHDYDQSTVVITNPNIDIDKYLPFRDDNLLVSLDHEASLQFTAEDTLPRMDGAAAVFPVYSAFVQEVYPENIKLYRWYYQSDLDVYLESDAFQYNNTPSGYRNLAEKNTDIFFGAYPSDEQIKYAQSQGTEFIYTPIGYEAFVFFVHKDNPIDSLTTEQIKGIYSGKITNWSQVGGKNEPIAAYQRNEGSGSQSMLIRFMGDTPLADPPTEMVSGSMGGIIETVANYRSKTNSIGFSFRYYVEGLIRNPDIKLIAIDGVAPTVENIQNGNYPIIAPLYAVTWEGNENENVQILIDWILSEEGQSILEQTGYTPVN